MEDGAFYGTDCAVRAGDELFFPPGELVVWGAADRNRAEIPRVPLSASPPAPEAAGRSLVSVGIGLLLTALHLAVMVVTCGAYVSGPTILVEAAKFLVLVIGGPGMIGLLVLFYLSIAALLALPPVGIVLANLRWPVCKLASAAIAPICMVLLAGQWALVRQVNPALPDRPPDERPCVRFTGDLSAHTRYFADAAWAVLAVAPD